jgi:hypothetical protein
MHDRAGKAKLDREKQEVTDKQQDVERLKARLAALEESRGRSNARPDKPSSAPPQN